MNIQELMLGDVNFSLDFEGDGVEHFDYNFSSKIKNYSEYNQKMNIVEIEQLRLNCQKILNLTKFVQ